MSVKLHLQVTSSPSPNAPNKTDRQQMDKLSVTKRACLVVDLDGFHLFKQFWCAELCWCSIDGQTGFQHFKFPFSFSDLSKKDKRTTEYCRIYVHDLRIDGRERRNVTPVAELDNIIASLSNYDGNANENVTQKTNFNFLKLLRCYSK